MDGAGWITPEVALEPVGGIGASGALGQEDEAVVRAALEQVVGGGG